MISLVYIGVLLVGYSVYSGRVPRRGVIGGVLLAVAGMLAAYDGTTRALREYASTHDGRVTPGVVVAKIDPTTIKNTGPLGRRRLARDLATLTSEHSRIHDALGRLILTGSPYAWTVEYRYECERIRGCSARDIVPEALWHELREGQAVNVRRPIGEIESSRLDDNPQWGTAMADLGIAAGLLVAAGLMSGTLGRRRPKYLTVPAVVTAVESVRTGDEPAWRITFAYFDVKGDTHEGSDEVIVAAWKPGDEGFAVFPPDQPDLATFRPADQA